MAFTDTQTRKLRGKLSAKHVKTRHSNGVNLSYLEGWHVIDEANRIFGFEGWDRETVCATCVWDDRKRETCRCAYTAKVKVRVRAGDTEIVREGNGSGEGKGATPGEAHEAALKGAETDATKRALATFGNRFGLALYDKDKAGVTKPRTPREGIKPRPLTLKSAAGIPGQRYSDPKAFSEAFSKSLGKVPTVQELFDLWEHNVESVRAIRKMPSPHAALADKLVARFKARAVALGDLRNPARGRQASEKLDKSELALSEPRRVRSREHLAFVARRPCLVCGRTPSQAHHVRFAQPQALGIKVSDEFTVPLCNIHHFELHQTGDERAWWNEKKIDPLAVAQDLWNERLGRTKAGGGKAEVRSKPAAKESGTASPAYRG